MFRSRPALLIFASLALLGVAVYLLAGTDDRADAGDFDLRPAGKPPAMAPDPSHDPPGIGRTRKPLNKSSVPPRDHDPAAPAANPDRVGGTDSGAGRARLQEPEQQRR